MITIYLKLEYHPPPTLLIKKKISNNIVEDNRIKIIIGDWGGDRDRFHSHSNQNQNQSQSQNNQNPGLNIHIRCFPKQIKGDLQKKTRIC